MRQAGHHIVVGLVLVAALLAIAASSGFASATTGKVGDNTVRTTEAVVIRCHGTVRTIHPMRPARGRCTLSGAISDRGKGFDANDEAIRNGLGLVSMRERVKQVFGSFEINSKLGKGTTIMVTVPLVPKASDRRGDYTRQAARALPLIDSGESPPRKS